MFQESDMVRNKCLTGKLTYHLPEIQIAKGERLTVVYGRRRSATNEHDAQYIPTFLLVYLFLLLTTIL